MENIKIGIDISFAKNIAIAWQANSVKKVNYATVQFTKSELDKETRNLYLMAQKVFDFLQKQINIENSEDIIIGVEGQFVNLNPNMTIQLVEIRSILQGMIFAIYPKIKQLTILPRQWQAKILKVSRMKSKEIKEVSKKEASKFLGEKIDNDDIADSINILRYVLKED